MYIDIYVNLHYGHSIYTGYSVKAMYDNTLNWIFERFRSFIAPMSLSYFKPKPWFMIDYIIILSLIIYLVDIELVHIWKWHGCKYYRAKLAKLDWWWLLWCDDIDTALQLVILTCTVCVPYKYVIEMCTRGYIFLSFVQTNIILLN